MLSTLSEKKMHAVRVAVFLAWCLLIVSLFYDPFSAIFTQPEQTWSWLADDNVANAGSIETCIQVQGRCLPLAPYAIGTRVFWGMVVPSAIFIVLVLGHEFWRRICPLYFFSQLPRALQLKPLLNIEQNAWLKQNHFYVQFVLFYLGITARILFVNALRPAAGIFFILTLLAAASVVALYGGRSWCHYVCPFGMVQTVFTGPKGLLASQAHTAKPYSITQSMCRTVDAKGNEESACVSCKSACMDIDAEQSYWAQLHKPGRKLVQYGYLGLVVGYFVYYWLYAGNADYYFSGVWSYESWRVDSLLGPGFYILNAAIPIPKLLAAPLTLGVFAITSCYLCTLIERQYRGILKQKDSMATADKSLHRMFSVCTFVAFNVFFIYGGRPEINKLPVAAQFAFQAVIAVVSSLWLYQSWGRSAELYQLESTADKQQRMLRKLAVNVDDLLKEKSLQQLDVREINILAKVLPQLVRNAQAQAAEVPVENSPTHTQHQLPRTAFRRKRANSAEASQANNPEPMSSPQTRIRRA
ncbi:MAG: 4Fe-4S binding protein [Cyanobacteria bacterium P01_C01_bin.121]